MGNHIKATQIIYKIVYKKKYHTTANNKRPKCKPIP